MPGVFDRKSTFCQNFDRWCCHRAEAQVDACVLGIEEGPVRDRVVLKNHKPEQEMQKNSKKRTAEIDGG